MPREITANEALAILLSGDFSQFVGAVENDHFEAKISPYQIVQSTC
jgi:hypothetical protein